MIREIREEEYTASASITYETLYLYDQSEAVGFILKCEDVDYGTYYYHKNLQGDITEIYDSSGTVVVKYAYDAFGNCQTVYVSISPANEYNSLRYRGYYYDSDTKLYYLKARYYNPEWRRFISPDETAYLDPDTPDGLNLYAYCNNDPVNYSDPSGCAPEWWEWALAGVLVTGLIVGALCTGGTLVGAALAGAAIGAGISVGTQAFYGELNWGQLALDTGVGAITGLIGGSSVSQGAATILGGLVGAASNFASQLITGTDLEDVSVMQILTAGIIGAISGRIGGAGARNKAAINQGKGVQSATKQLNKVMRRIANGYRYNPTTAQVAFTNAMNELTNSISSQMGRMFSIAMVSYGISTVSLAGIDALFDYLDWWFF